MAAGDVPGAVSVVQRRVRPGARASWHRSWRWRGRASWRTSASMATGLYAVCSRTDGAYLAAAQFGLARLAQADGRTADALAALGRIPPVSRAYGEARRQRASLLVGDGAATPDDLAAASLEVERAGLPPRERTALHVEILEAALATTVHDGDQPSTRVVGRDDDGAGRARALESAYRSAAEAERRPGRADRVGRPGQHRATAHAHMSEATRRPPSRRARPAARRSPPATCSASRAAAELDQRPPSKRRLTTPTSTTRSRWRSRATNRRPAPSSACHAAVRSSRTGSARPAAPSSRHGATTSPRLRPTWWPASATRASDAAATRTPWRWPSSASEPSSWCATA